MSGRADAPKTVDQLIDGPLMARLDALDVTSRKIFQGKVQGERRSRRDPRRHRAAGARAV